MKFLSKKQLEAAKEFDTVKEMINKDVNKRVDSMEKTLEKISGDMNTNFKDIDAKNEKRFKKLEELIQNKKDKTPIDRIINALIAIGTASGWVAFIYTLLKK